MNRLGRSMVLWLSILLGARLAGAQAPQPSEEHRAPPEAPAEEKPAPAASGQAAEGEQLPADLEVALSRLAEALSPLESVAIIRAEASGTGEDLRELEKAILSFLSARGRPRVIDPDEAFRRAGVEFAASPAGIAAVAAKLQVAAAVFPRVFVTPEGVELQLWAVDANGQTLLDETFRLERLPAAAEAPHPAPATEPGPVPTPSADLSGYYKRALALAPRARGGAGVGVGFGFSTGNVAVGVQSGGGEAWLDWMVTEGGRPVPETRLVELAGRDDIAKRIERKLGRYRTLRNVGLGMTLGGFITAGIAAPYFKQGTDQGLTGAGVAVGLGLAIGSAGLVLWLNYASMIAGADSPWPAHHLISQEEAEEMIELVNERLMREMGLPRATTSSDSGALRFGFSPSPGGAALFWSADF